MKAEDYKPYCRGQQVMVQLKGNMLMGVEGDEGIELAQAQPLPPGAWEAQIREAMEKETGATPTPQELQEALAQNPPPPGRPVMMPIIIGTLEYKDGCAVLFAHYDYTEQDAEGRPRSIKMEVTVDPDDIKHISHIVSGKLVT